MSIWIAIILGLAQGLCEFLPVSSSGHLVLLQNIFGVEKGALFFSVMLHVGTLIAVLVVYRKQILEMLRHPIQKKVGMLLLSTVVTTVIAFVFKDVFDQAYEGAFLGFSFLFTAVLLILTERVGIRATKKIKDMTVLQAGFIGLMQGVAILPGVSRSGSTIAGAMYTGLERKDAADYSFLMCIPAILGSLVLELPDAISGGAGDINWLAVIIGMAVAAVSGYFAIRFMLRVITKKRLRGFAIYVAVLGVLVLLDQFVFHLFFTQPF
ncbi:MAG: undecaprenyl-diphosphate phosphatase [Clostridia bacterium]|nr:undecaprenyl-diphosphate phosphatase [Clostridia bacterium]MBR0026562.1 undecaprenyl-diphosphate phosphatase [Clostridia bacterium]